jgi:hypothetical protein
MVAPRTLGDVAAPFLFGGALRVASMGAARAGCKP